MIKHIVQTGIWGAILITFCTIHPVISQEVAPFLIPRTNSSATLTQTIASTKIEINYHRPNKRGREIFGSLVPYGKIWRTGSDEATRVYFSTPVQLEGHLVDSGSYELFTIPGPTGWETISGALIATGTPTMSCDLRWRHQHPWQPWRHSPSAWIRLARIMV